MNRRTVLLGLAALTAGSAAALHQAFISDLARATRRSSGQSSIASSRFGAIEYAVAGEGRPVLMVHGTGGGFDQGLAAAPRLIAAGYKVIAPSRFGYLRSALPADASSEHQADAFADLLDALGIDRAPIIGVSAGAFSALAFGIRHPDRCAAVLPVVPATYVPGRLPQPPSRLAAAIYEHALTSDFLFWLGLKVAESTMIQSVLATNIEIFRSAPLEEQRRARQLLWDILPVSRRGAGLRNDARLAGRPQPMAIENITAPILTISLEDDLYGTLEAARHIAATAPRAKLISYRTGGHVWLGHDIELYAEIDTFLRTLDLP